MQQGGNIFSFHFLLFYWCALMHCSVPVCSVWMNVDFGLNIFYSKVSI